MKRDPALLNPPVCNPSLKSADNILDCWGKLLTKMCLLADAIEPTLFAEKPLALPGSA